MEARRALLSLCVCVVLLVAPPVLSQDTCLGKFRVMGSIGISPITVSQSKDGFLYLFDRRDLGGSKLFMPDGTYAHAVRYRPRANTWVPIESATNTWCSAGGYLWDGTIINTAGNDFGRKAIRLLRPCTTPYTPLVGGVGPKACNVWWENGTMLHLNTTRWYPTTQVLPDKRVFVVGGSVGGDTQTGIVPDYEYIDPLNAAVGRRYPLDFLMAARPNYLYPFVHLLPCDKLFIFAKTSGIILDYHKNKVYMDVPQIPDNISRTYPSTGSSLLLPLDHTTGYQRAEVLFCGGNAIGAGSFTPASKACWIIDVSNPLVGSKAKLPWRGPYNLPRARCMGDLLYLLDGSFLSINGIQTGKAGFGVGRDPNYWPDVLIQNSRGGISVNPMGGHCGTNITRAYHASAILVPDGRVLLSGSNQYGKYNDDPKNPLRSEYRLEMWYPPYMYQTHFPRMTILRRPRNIAYGRGFRVRVGFPQPPDEPPSPYNMRFALISNAFTTHSLSMNLRYVTLPFYMAPIIDGQVYTIKGWAPPSPAIAPPGPYMLAITYKDIPAGAKWVMLG